MTSLEEALRRSVPLFRIAPFYTKVKPAVAHSEISPPQREWTLWLARAEKDLPDWLVLDEEARVNPTRLEACLEPVSDEDMVDRMLASLPEEHRLKIFRIATTWNWQPQSKDEPLTAKELVARNIVVRPVPQLKDPSYLKDMEWPQFVEELTAYRTSQKDPVLKRVHQAHLLRGIDVGINPNTLQVTNGGTGKSTFYTVAGENFGKVTAKAFLGFAKSPLEVYPGVIDGSDLPIGIDQIESQSAPQIMRFMFNALESGEDTVISGAAKFKVRTSSCFSLLANPIGYGADQTKSFASLMDHLSLNPALGRRFGLIIFGKDFARITKKPSPDELTAWRHRISMFRAVEEYVWDRLRRLVHSSEVWEWVNSPIPGYDEQVQGLIGQLQDETVRTFIEEHAAGGQRRIRGAALHATLAGHLAELALGSLETGDLLEACDEPLQEYVEINLGSISRICKEWAKEQSAQTRMMFETLPDYLREIVSAIELYRRTTPDQVTVMLSVLTYQPSTETYPTLHTCVRKLSKLKRATQTLEKLKRYFAFDLVACNGDWKVTLLERKPVQEITPLGKLVDRVNQFDQLTNVTDWQESQESQEKSQKGSLKHWSNGQNGQSGQDNEQEHVSLQSTTSLGGPTREIGECAICRRQRPLRPDREKIWLVCNVCYDGQTSLDQKGDSARPNK